VKCYYLPAPWNRTASRLVWFVVLLTAPALRCEKKRLRPKQYDYFLWRIPRVLGEFILSVVHVESRTSEKAEDWLRVISGEVPNLVSRFSSHARRTCRPAAASHVCAITIDITVDICRPLIATAFWSHMMALWKKETAFPHSRYAIMAIVIENLPRVGCTPTLRLVVCT
jgi:hypothetical protein